MAKKFFWLKLMNDFFQQPKMKKLRRIAGGDTYTIIYLKMQLLSLKTDGKLYFDGVEETFAEELALTIDEEEENVLFTLMYLQKQGLIEQMDDREYVLPETVKNIGSEAASTERVRRLRERRKAAEALSGKEVAALPAQGEALQCNADATTCNTEKEKEKEKELELELELERAREGEKELSTGDKSPEPPHAQKKNSRFVPPTLEEVRAYCAERKNGVNAEKFHDHYTAANWFRGKTKIRDWKACIRTWEQKDKEQRAQDQRGRIKTEEEHAQGGHASGFGW